MEYHLINTLEKLEVFEEYIKSVSGIVAVDTETTSLEWWKPDFRLMGVSLTTSPNESFYIQFNEYNSEGYFKHFETNYFSKAREVTEKLLTNSTTKVVMFNAAFDIPVLRKTIGVDCLENLHADVQLMKHTCWEQRPHGLKDIAVMVYGDSAKDEQNDLKQDVISKGGSWNKEKKDIYKADTSILSKYAMKDTELTYNLYFHFLGELEKEGLTDFYFKDEVHPLTKIIISDMIYYGVKIDRQYVLNLKQELEKKISDLEVAILNSIRSNHPKEYNILCRDLLDKEVPLKSGGLLFQVLYEEAGLPLVYNKKTSEPTFNKKVIEYALEMNPESNLLKWKLGKITDSDFMALEGDFVNKCRETLFLQKTGQNSVFNFRSTQQLGNFLFGLLGEEQTKTTETGKFAVDEEVLEPLSKKYEFVSHLLELKKAEKLLSTYLEPILQKITEQDLAHPGWFQPGTESGRLSCASGLNMMNLPSEDLRIKMAFIARLGNVFIGADASSLEPRVFTHVSKEKSLIDSFWNNVDFYGNIATFLLDYKGNPSTMKEDGFKKERDMTKVFALSVAYGATKYRISKQLSIPVEQAEYLIGKYWTGLPKLKQFVFTSHGRALRDGFVQSEAGRKRRFHGLQELQMLKHKDKEAAYKLKSLLNVSVNFQIQSLAASIINRSMILLKNLLTKEGLCGKIVSQIHDEIIVECPKEEAERTAELLKFSMENAYKISVPLISNPIIGNRMSEIKE